MSSLPHPAMVGRYVIRREIGSGGQSRVYEADDPQHHRTVAVKLFTVDDGDDTALRAIDREIEALSKFDDHPNVVTLHDSGIHFGQPFLVMTYYASGSLMELIRSGGPASVDDVIECARNIAGALVSLHKRNIVHRDIKPHNVFIGDHGFVLGDLGISLDVSGERSISQASDMFTPPYSAPEVIEGRASTKESDMYALGATLYHMAAGRRPFMGSGVELHRQIVEDPAPPLERDDLAEEFRSHLMRLLSKPSGDRWSAEAFAKRIQGLSAAPPAVAGTGGAGSVANRVPSIYIASPEDRTRVATKSNPRVWLIIAAAVVLVVVVAVGLGTSIGPEQESKADEIFEPSAPAADPFADDQIAPPSNLVVTETATDYVLTWTAIEPADSYRIVSVQASGRRDFVGDTAEPTFTIALDPDLGLCFEVSAIKGTAISPDPASSCVGDAGNGAG